MITPELRVEALLDDLEEIVAKRYDSANDDPHQYRTSNISESDLLRQIRIRLARFRQGY